MMEGSSGNGLYANSITKANKVVKHGPLHSFAIWCMNESNFDDLVFFIIFCVCAFIYLPLPADNPAMPFFRLFLYFSMTILEYSVACRLPPKIRVIVHPIILTAALVMAGIGYFERCKGFDIRHGVNLYKTGISFVSLVTKSNVGWPGGGDILSAAMDVSIISLAFNVYKSRPASIREVNHGMIFFYICIHTHPILFFLIVDYRFYFDYPHGILNHVCDSTFCTWHWRFSRR
jgi:hypothetical protein